MKNFLLLITSLFLVNHTCAMQSGTTQSQNTQNHETVTIENTHITRFETPQMTVYRRETPVRNDFATLCKDTGVITATAYDSNLRPIQAASNPNSLFHEIERQFNTRAL